MEHTITISADGSSTLKLKEYNESYHSVNGAYGEATHIYINNGLQYLANANKIYIYDIGMGTGLNCLLSLLWQQDTPNSPIIYYCGIEKYPIPMNEIKQLNFPQYIAEQMCGKCENTVIVGQLESIFSKIHESPWETDINLSSRFILHKSKTDITVFNPPKLLLSSLQGEQKAIIFYDTFSPDTQPELWDKQIFKRFYDNIPCGSILVTYSSKGSVKQALRDAGFTVKRLPGANGKRHMVIATV